MKKKPVDALAKKGAAADVRLNKFISHAGICSRREADALIQAGYITVNDQKVTALGYQVKPGDVIKYRGKVLKADKSVYILLNKPKDYVTTTDDPEGRKTVLDLVKDACTERIYPVGRLDRNTTGLLVLTNDGALAQTLAHPSSGVKKLYQVVLDKPLKLADLQAIQAGVRLVDGIVTVDEVAIVSADGKSVGIALHIGRNRIIRRLFEHLNYGITKLDRVMYAHLSKKDLPRGKWRFLKPQEVARLKQLARKT